MTRRTSTLAAFATVMMLSTAATAAPSTPPTTDSSASPAAVEEARTRYAQGKQLYADGDYRLAAIEFQRSYDLTHNFQALYNLGQVHYQLNNYAKAAQILTRYLADGGAQIPAARRTEVETDLKWLLARTAEVTISANVDDAEVTLDDMPIGSSPIKALLIDAGEHRIAATKAGRERALRTVVCAGGDKVDVKLVLPEIATVKVVTAPTKKSYTWVGWVATGALTAGALAVGVVTLFKYTDYRDEKNAPAGADDPTGSAKRAAIDQKSSKATTYAVTTGIIGGAALVTGGISLYFTVKDSGPSTPAPNVVVTLNTQGLLLNGRF